MRHHALTLLLVLPVLAATALAEETGAATPSATALAQRTPEPARIAELELALATVTRQRDELASQQESSLQGPESPAMEYLRQENQKLKLQLRKALAQQPQSLLTETQSWYLIGAVTALLGAAIGALLRGNRRRRQWIN